MAMEGQFEFVTQLSKTASLSQFGGAVDRIKWFASTEMTIDRLQETDGESPDESPQIKLILPFLFLPSFLSLPLTIYPYILSLLTVQPHRQSALPCMTRFGDSLARTAQPDGDICTGQPFY